MSRIPLHRRVTILWVLMGCLLAWVQYLNADRVADAKHLAADKAVLADKESRDLQVQAHASCVRLDEAGELVQIVILRDLKIFASADPHANTPEAQKIINKMVSQIAASNKALLGPVDCDQEDPLPPNPTRAEKLAGNPPTRPVPPPP